MEKKYYCRGLGLGIIVTAIIMGIALSGGRKTREMTDDEVIARAKELGMTENTRLLEPSETNADEDKADEADSDAQSPGGEENAEEAETPVKKDVAVKTEAEAAKKDAEQPAETDMAAGTAEKPTVDTPKPLETTTSVSSTQTTSSAASTGTKANTNEMTRQDDDTEPASSETAADSGTGTAASGTAGNGSAKPASTGTTTITIASGDSSYTIAKKLETAGVVSSASAYDTYLCERGYDKKLRAGTFQIPAGATDEQIAKIVTGQ